MEPACSNIAMERTVNDHISYMTRVRTKFKMDGEISRNWSASAWETLRLLHSTRMWGITRDGYGCHHLPPTPQLGGMVISEGSRAPEHHARVKEITHVPLGLRPYRSTSKNMGKPEGMTNCHLIPSSTSTHTSYMNG